MSTNPIRILQMIGGLNMGGSQAFVMNLYRNIDKSQIQFDFVLDHPNERFFVPEVEKMGAKVYFLPSFNGKNANEVIKSWNHFFEEHKEYRVLHSHIRSYASLYIHVAKKHGVKTIIHSHSTSNGSGISSVVKAIMQYPLRYQADILASCSNYAGNWLFGKKKCKSEKYVFLPNAINLETYKIDPTIREQYRKNLNVSNERVYCHVGRLHEAKNHMFLLEVFNEIRIRESNSHLLIVGAGTLEEKIKEKIRELELEKHVSMLGARNDVAQLMMASDVFLFPSKWEGLPVTVVEAQASGLPCLISDRITHDVVLSDLVEMMNLSSSIQWAERAIKMSGRKDVHANIISAGFSVNDLAKKMLKLYNKLYEESNE